MKKRVEQILWNFFTWCFRTFRPRKYAEKLAIEASNRIRNTILDTRGGPGNREAVNKAIKFNNSRKGSRYIKQRPQPWTPKTDKYGS